MAGGWLPATVNKPRVWHLNDDNTNGELRYVLLVSHSLVDCHQNIERFSRSREQRSILKRRPAFLLCRANVELRQVSPELARHVLVEQYLLHAI